MPEPTNDVFLCYNSRDRTAVERLAHRLRDGGFRVFFDQWSLIPGRPWQEGLEDGLRTSRVCAVFVGAGGLGPWQNEEMRVALDARVREEPKHVIPVLLPGAEESLPTFLARLHFVDFRAGLDDGHAFYLLTCAVRGVAPGPGPPTNGPAPAKGDRRPNPFHVTLAVRDAARFVGREAELRRLRGLLAGGCVAILGEPKVGKSSLVLELKRGWNGDVLGPIDFHGVEDRDDFYDTLAAQLGLEASDWRSVRSKLRRCRALLLLDELDAAPPDKLAAEDLGRLRAVCHQNHDLKLAVVSRGPVKDLFPDSGRGSPVYNFLVPFELGPMTDDDVRRLLAPWGKDLVFDPATVEEIVRLVGGHPFKAQLAAHHRYESLVDPSHDWTVWERDWEQLR